MKTTHKKNYLTVYIYFSLVATFLSCNSKTHTIAYAPNSGDINIYSGNTEGKTENKKIPVQGGYLAWSPNGKQIAFYAKYDDKRTWSIHTVKSDGTHKKRLTHAKHMWDSSPSWSPDGEKIVFAREYQNSKDNWLEEIWIMNSDGSNKKQIDPLVGGGPYVTQSNKILYHSKIESYEICIADISGSNINQLTNNHAKELHPEVSPNGKQIAFMSDRDGNFEIYIMNIDGSNQTRLTNNDVDDWHPSWSPDGSKIIFSSAIDYEKEKHIYMMNTDGSDQKRIISYSGYAVFKR